MYPDIGYIDHGQRCSGRGSVRGFGRDWGFGSDIPVAYGMNVPFSRVEDQLKVICHGDDIGC